MNILKKIRRALGHRRWNPWIVTVLGITGLLVIGYAYFELRTSVSVSDVTWSRTANNECTVSFIVINTSSTPLIAQIPIYVYNVHWEGAGKYQHEVSTLLGQTSLQIKLLPSQPQARKETVKIAPFSSVTMVKVYVVKTSETPLLSVE